MSVDLGGRPLWCKTDAHPARFLRTLDRERLNALRRPSSEGEEFSWAGLRERRSGFTFDTSLRLCSSVGSLYRMKFWGAVKNLKRFRVLMRITFEGEAVEVHCEL